MSLTVLLAGGHLLIEDVPGVGKTMLAKSLARTLGVTVRRLQFTPDLLPSDVTGISIFNQETRQFEFRPGPVFANVVLADEINRASPKTQSALLEAMEERQVSIDGITHPLAAPFMVIATQNPVDMEGTYALPEAQRDRFMAQISLGYPAAADELRMLADHAGDDPLDRLRPGLLARRARRADGRGRLGARLRAGAQPGGRHRARDPHLRCSCAWAPPPGPPCIWCEPAAPGLRWRAGPSSCPTTCSCSVRPSWGIALLLAAPTAAAGRTGHDVVADLQRRLRRNAWS